MKKAYLILENGDVYAGNSIGVPGDSVGEVVFTTGMGSYMETLTDPSYYGQIITQTFPLIGNYGAISADSESRRRTAADTSCASCAARAATSARSASWATG